MSIKILRPLLAITGALVLTAAPSFAQIYNETGDAGQTLGTAQFTGLANGSPLTAITGTLLGQNDADVFVFTITSTTTFSASTVNANTSLDTALFLFSASGVPIYTNDDASGASFQSTLPANSSFTMTLSPGRYYLGISLSGNEPVNSAAQLLFAPFPNGNSTAVRGPAAQLNPNTLANFTNGAIAQTGAYRIDLTASATAAVPEPSTSVLLVVCGAVLALAFQKRRQPKSRA